MASQFIRLTFVLLSMAFIPIGQSNLPKEQDQIVGGLAACLVSSTNPSTTFCTGSPGCANTGLTHYSWEFFGGEDSNIMASVYCSAFTDFETTPPTTCGGSARSDTLTTSCTPNW